MSVLYRAIRKQRNRRGLRKSANKSMLDITPSSVTFSTPNVVVTMPVRVNLKGIPDYVTSTGKHPTSASIANGNVITLVYDTPGAATGIVIPGDDPAVTTFQGGRVRGGTYSFPE